MVIKVRGILDFFPEDVTRKHEKQSEWKCVAIIKTDCDIDLYYAWFLKKRFNLELNKNLRRTHVTFINDRMKRGVFNEAAKLFHGKEIDFYYEIEPRSNGQHWWLRVHCPEAESIREAMGLERNPYFGLHLTLGNAILKYPEVENDAPQSVKSKKDFLEHSKYILRMCKKFELISNDPKKQLSEHTIF